MQVERIDCRDWREFKNRIITHLFRDEPFVRGELLYRGQRDAGWQLKSSYDRWFDAAGFDEGERITLAKELLAEFNRTVATLEAQTPRCSEDLQTHALAQHYGLPTRLLDWSESPYIAAYFAFAEALAEQSTGSVAVWALNTKSFAWEEDRGVKLVTAACSSNVRLRNQEGRFTLLRSVAKCIEDHLASLRADGAQPLYQFRIPASQARYALTDPDIMGINPARLFGDLEGCAVHAKLACIQRRMPKAQRRSAVGISG
jgi:hypothetical protein